MAYGRKTGGRKKGTKNKSTERLEAEMKKTMKLIEQSGGKSFNGDAHSLLMMIYMNEAAPMEMRLDAAKSAIRFEKPALASTDNRNTDTTRYVVALPHGETSMEEWQAKYAPNDRKEPPAPKSH